MTALQPLLRINNFAVAPAHRAALLDLLRHTHNALRPLPGLLRATILEKRSGPSRYRIVTLLEIADEAAVPALVAALEAADRAAGIDRAAVMQALECESDMGLYAPLKDSA